MYRHNLSVQVGLYLSTYAGIEYQRWGRQSTNLNNVVYGNISLFPVAGSIYSCIISPTNDYWDWVSHLLILRMLYCSSLGVCVPLCAGDKRRCYGSYVFDFLVPMFPSWLRRRGRIMIRITRIGQRLLLFWRRLMWNRLREVETSITIEHGCTYLAARKTIHHSLDLTKRRSIASIREQ